MKNGRLVAFEIIQSIIKDGAYSNIALEKGIVNAPIKDRAFVSRLVYGVIERKLTLDYIVDKFLTSRTKPKVKLVLYIGIYQIYFMDKVPNAVAVNETVKLADEIGLSYYKKLINAVLHKAIEFVPKFDNINDLDIKYSCPKHLINMWNKMYGEDTTIKILEAINNRPPIFAIPNKKYVDAEELQYELFDAGIDCEVYEDVVKINSSFDLKNSKSFNDGLFYIEDFSSYSAAKALNVEENDIVLDMCAAPGGKSFTMAQNLINGGKLYSFDLYEHKIKLINDTSKRLGLDNVIISKVNDATVFDNTIPKADKILCDVVCSGFGIIRRKPEIRYKNLDELKELPDIQYKILNTSVNYLKENGKITYSTCTLNKKENEKVINKFLEEHNDFIKIEEKTFIPNINSGDGFYYAILQRQHERN